MRRAAVRSVVVALAWLALLVAPAAADPAQPGDVRSRVTELAPRTTGVRAEILGGDSFLQLEVDRGREVVVLGYESEPYLRVRPEGTVEVNDRSPARWVNDDRLGSAAVPDTADASAAPDWRVIGEGGKVAWHDHRTHWMAPTRPDPPAVDWTVPILVDGQAVTVHGRYAYVPPPSPWPWWAGVAAAAALTLWLGWSRSSGAAAAVGVAGLLAGVVGLALLRLPGGGAPGVSAVTLGALAVVGSVVAWRWPGRAVAGAFLAGGGAALVVYGLSRVDVLDHAVLVTALPAWLDRASVAVAIGVGAGAVVLGARAVVVPGRSVSDRPVSRQLGGYQPSGTRASASGGPQDPRS